MRAEIVGIPPVPTGLTWASGTIEFAFDPNWSDGAGRGPGTITGILQPTTKDKFVVPGSLGALFVPATPTGIGVIRGPLMSMRWQLTDSQGREYRVDSVFPDSLLADAGNLFNVNALGATPTYVTSAGPAPVGVDLATGDARYVRFTSAATTGASGIASLATDAEAIAGAVTNKAIVPSSLKAAIDLRLNLASVAALQGVTAAQRTLGVIGVIVTGVGQYLWDSANTRVSGSNEVVRPTDIAADATPGRWILIATLQVLAIPGTPMSMVRSSGILGTPAFNTTAVAFQNPLDCGLNTEFLITPASVGDGLYTMAAPTGYKFKYPPVVSVRNNAGGSPMPNVAFAPNGTLVIGFPNTAAHSIVVQSIFSRI